MVSLLYRYHAQSNFDITHRYGIFKQNPTTTLINALFNCLKFFYLGVRMIIFDHVLFSLNFANKLTYILSDREDLFYTHLCNHI